MTTERVTTSDEVHKRTEKITTNEDSEKGTDEVHKCTDEITTSKEVEKGSEKLEDTKEAVVTIRRKDSDQFEVQSKVSTGWFNLDHEFQKRKFSTLEPDFYKRLYEKNIERLDMESYKKFIVPFDFTKLKILFPTIQFKKIESDDEEGTENSESSSDKKRDTKEKVVAPIFGKITSHK